MPVLIRSAKPANNTGFIEEIRRIKRENFMLKKQVRFLEGELVLLQQQMKKLKGV